jgi:hypothetical protein
MGLPDEERGDVPRYTHEQFNGTSRQGWETNSSSSHSLVLDPSGEATFRKAAEFGFVEDGVLTIHGKTEFGWEWEIWDDPGDKVNYLLIDGFPVERMVHLLTTRLNVEDVKFEMVRKMEGIGNRNAGWELVDEKGSIDHQSRGTSGRIAAFDDDRVWAFLTNPKCMIRGGNDNSEGPW